MPPAISNPIVAAIVFFGSERLMRDELPRLIPGGELSAVRAPRMRVRTRMLVAFVLLGLLPLAVLSMAALTRADALRTADAVTAFGMTSTASSFHTASAQSGNRRGMQSGRWL